MKRLTKAQWREAGVFNPWGICVLGGGKVFISWRTRGDSHSYQIRAWQVHGIERQTDPEAHWTDNGSKTFTPFDVTKEQALIQAKAWACEKYHIKEWVRDPFGAWQSAAVFARATELARRKGATK